MDPTTALAAACIVAAFVAGIMLGWLGLLHLMSRALLGDRRRVPRDVPVPPAAGYLRLVDHHGAAVADVADTEHLRTYVDQRQDAR